MKKRLVMIAGVCVCTLIAAAGLYQNYSKNEKYQKQLFAMDTYMEFTAYGRGGQQAVEKAAKEVQRLDALLSAQNEESQVYALNQRGSLEVSDDLAEIIQRGKEIFQETDGLFDDTIYPLMELWGFPTGEYHVPSGEEIENLLPDVDGGTVEISGNTVTAAMSISDVTTAFPLIPVPIRKNTIVTSPAAIPPAVQNIYFSYT